MANGNPFIPQGVLNRLKASVVFTDFPQLNVTVPYLDKEQISIRFEGQSSMQHETATGLVQSPEPYIAVSVVIALLRTQGLSDAYKTQQEANVVLGDCSVYPDVTNSGNGALGQYNFSNMAIQSVGDLLLNGTTPIYGVTLRGIYYINNALWL